jgi:hypothetical protein
MPRPKESRLTKAVRMQLVLDTTLDDLMIELEEKDIDHVLYTLSQRDKGLSLAAFPDAPEEIEEGNDHFFGRVRRPAPPRPHGPA